MDTFIILNGENKAIDQTGNFIDIPNHKVRFLKNNPDSCLRLVQTKTGRTQLRSGTRADFDEAVKTNSIPLQDVNNVKNDDQTKVENFLAESIFLKPTNLIISDLKWKYLMRSVLRGKNIMMTGPSGTGKTLSVQSVAKALDGRPFFYFNLGATQDPRSTLIGNTHFSKDKGTFVADALFVQAIQTENSIILMDELTRATPDAWNILMSVLDENQRYLRIDERPDTPTIKVASGVTFIATANIGSEYTSTRVLDRAILDRFSAIVEMNYMSIDNEVNLLKMTYPDVDQDTILAIAEIANTTRVQIASDNPRVTTAISSRVTMEMAGLIHDGFSLEEVAEVSIYPFYSEAGGTDSERTFMKQVVQKYIKVDAPDQAWQTPDSEEINNSW
jgi:MoxR-like ATPase